jgi:hypothetical protein
VPHKSVQASILQHNLQVVTWGKDVLVEGCPTGYGGGRAESCGLLSPRKGMHGESGYDE